MLPNALDMFWKRVEKLSNNSYLDKNKCLIWMASTSGFGHGRMYFMGKPFTVHRLLFCLKYNLNYFDKNFQINHKCDNPRCFNDLHLYKGTQQDNINDTVIRKRHINSKKTHCPQGHEYTLENTKTNYVGHRRCKICLRKWWNNSNIKRKNS